MRHRQRSGRPSKADAAYKQRIHELMDTDPRDVGLDFNVWTINRLRLYLHDDTGILLSYTRFRTLLSRLGYRWKQPKHDLSHLQDEQAQEAADELLDWLKKTHIPHLLILLLIIDKRSQKIIYHKIIVQKLIEPYSNVSNIQL